MKQHLTNEEKMHLLDEVKHSVIKAIQEIFPDELSLIRIKTDLVVIENHPYTDSQFLKILIHIKSPNPNRYVGLVHREEFGKQTGPYSFYITGFIDASLYLKLPREYSMIDEVELIFSESNGQIELNDLIEVEIARKRGFIQSGSEFDRILSTYNLPYILVIGSSISGPDLDIIKTAEQFDFRDMCILDMFSGTGAITAVCLQKGAKHVVAVEQNARALKTLKSRFPERLSVVEQDAFSFQSDEYFDVAFFNPYYDDAISVARHIIPKMKANFQKGLLSVGSRWNTPYLEKVINILSNNEFNTKVIKGSISNIIELEVKSNV